MCSLNKSLLSAYTFRIAEAQQEGAPLIDVDGSYIYKKFKTLIEGGLQVASLPCPTPPISGWRAVNRVVLLALVHLFQLLQVVICDINVLISKSKLCTYKYSP